MDTAKVQAAVERGVVKTAGAIPEWLQRRLGGRPIHIDGQTLHPEVRLALRLMSLVPATSFETLPLDQARAQIFLEAELFGGEPVSAHVEDRVLDGDLPARLYRPLGGTTPDTMLVYFHGGGWVLGGIASSDTVCRYLAQTARTQVLSIDYRLAPESPFPAAVEDAIAAFEYVVSHAAELGVDPAKVAVGGDSAGGNLAAVISQQTVAKGGPSPVFQLLFFPVTDLSSKHASYQLFSDGFFLTEKQMDWYAEHYVPSAADRLDPRASPLLAPDLTGQPPAYVAVAGFDPLRDEGIAYAERLKEAGVVTELRIHDALIHGFVNSLGVGRTGKAAMAEAAIALRRGLAP